MSRIISSVFRSPSYFNRNFNRDSVFWTSFHCLNPRLKPLSNLSLHVGFHRDTILNAEKIKHEYKQETLHLDREKERESNSIKGNYQDIDLHKQKKQIQSMQSFSTLNTPPKSSSISHHSYPLKNNDENIPYQT